jgi:RNase P subunit RPR2
VKDIMARDGVKCECGEKTQSVSINFSSVDITCKTCGAAMRIPAATASDVEDICCKNTLVLHKKR